MTTPAPLRRHQLVRLNASGWQRLLDAQPDGPQRECMALWAAQGWPLVVCRQPCTAPADGRWTLGLAAPSRWNRARWTVEVRPDEVLVFDEFPFAPAVAGLLPAALRPAWHALCRALQAQGTAARVYGSHGWQQLTGRLYLRPTSDLDLCIAVHDAAAADAAVQLLAAADPRLPRLDGELVLPDGSGVAWREWRDWRAGRVRAVLVKRVDGIELVGDPERLGAALACIAEPA